MSETSKMASVWAVQRGRRTGLFTSWDGPGGCREQVEDFEGAVFRRFKNPKKASRFVRNDAAAEARPDAIEYLRIPGREASDETEPLVLFVDGHVRRSNPDPEQPGIPIGGYGVWFSDRDPRNVKEKFSLPEHTTERCEIMGVARAIEIGAPHANGAGLTIAVNGSTVPDGLRQMIDSGGLLGLPKKNSGLFRHLWTVATTCDCAVSVLYLPVAKGERRADRQ